jgi:hypothetical protein
MAMKKLTTPILSNTERLFNAGWNWMEIKKRNKEKNK